MDICLPVENISHVQFKHLKEFVSSVINLKGKRTISNISRQIVNGVNRSNMTRFLSSSPWDDEAVQESHQNTISKIIEKVHFKTNKPIFQIIDDTIITKPRTTKKIDFLGKLFSHVSGRYENAHCLVAHHCSVDELSIPINSTPYFKEELFPKGSKEFKSKVDIAIEEMLNLKVDSSIPRYLLVDKWFASAKLMMTVLKHGIYTIAPLKSNRVIYPYGIKNNIKDFAQSLDTSTLNQVTVQGKKYLTYRYEGNIKGIENCVIIISWECKNDTLKEPVFLCSTDIALSDGAIIEYYLKRWKIEVSFRYQKNSLGLAHYQMRKMKGIKRYWLIIQLAMTYLSLRQYQNSKFRNIGDVIVEEKTNNFETNVSLIIDLYESGKNKRKICEFLKSHVA
jgi:hypothetical protein